MRCLDKGPTPLRDTAAPAGEDSRSLTPPARTGDRSRAAGRPWWGVWRVGRRGEEAWRRGRRGDGRGGGGGRGGERRRRRRRTREQGGDKERRGEGGPVRRRIGEGPPGDAGARGANRERPHGLPP